MQSATNLVIRTWPDGVNIQYFHAYQITVVDSFSFCLSKEELDDHRGSRRVFPVLCHVYGILMNGGVNLSMRILHEESSYVGGAESAAKEILQRILHENLVPIICRLDP